MLQQESFTANYIVTTRQLATCYLYYLLDYRLTILAIYSNFCNCLRQVDQNFRYLTRGWWSGFSKNWHNEGGSTVVV